MLFTLTSVKSLEGRLAGGHFTNRILFASSLAPGAQQLYDFANRYAILEAPVLSSKLEIYTITISPIAVPGTRKRERNNHVTRYINEIGGHAVGANVDPGLLTVGAIFYKYATMGTAGEIFMRGVLSEDELKSNPGGEPNNANALDDDALNARFRTYANGLVPLFGSLPGGRMVMPGVAKNPDGTIPTMAQYEATARQIAKVEFDGFGERQIHKATRTIEAKGLELMRSKGKRLQTAYNDALQAANNVPGNIPQETREDLADLGREIYRQFTIAERQKLNLPSYVKTYIHA
jgi:hypothetical protein